MSAAPQSTPAPGGAGAFGDAWTVATPLTGSDDGGTALVVAGAIERGGGGKSRGVTTSTTPVSRSARKNRLSMTSGLYDHGTGSNPPGLKG